MRPHLPAWIAAVVAAFSSLPATYALLRAYDVVLHSEPNPATIVWSPHIAMFWRLLVAVYVAGMLGPLVFMAARRDLGRTARVLSASVLVVGAIAGLQGLFMP